MNSIAITTVMLYFHVTPLRIVINCKGVCLLVQGWKNYGLRVVGGPPDHSMQPAGTYRNFYASLIVSIK